MGPDPVSLRVSLFSAAGTGPFDPTAGQPISLPPWGWVRIADADLLRKTGFPSGYALVERVAGSGPLGVYGVVNDQATNDASCLPAVGP